MSIAIRHYAKPELTELRHIGIVAMVFGKRNEKGNRKKLCPTEKMPRMKGGILML